MTITTCPLCNSTDLERFEDETGAFCFGCDSNAFDCKVCGAEAAAVYPVGTPDMCAGCHEAAWERIEARARTQAPMPANTTYNVWD